MATSSKQLFLTLFHKINKNNVILVRLGNNFQPHLSIVHCSTSAEPENRKLNKAMKTYLEKAAEYVPIFHLNELLSIIAVGVINYFNKNLIANLPLHYNSIDPDNFLKEQLNEYDMGKKFLATMMGKKGEMTQKDIDEAIEYLFPCGLFVPKSRPVMKPPEEIFAKRKPVQFDYTGRPFHFLFYTGRPKYTQCLHDAATQLKKLNEFEAKMQRSGGESPAKKLVLVGSWMSKEEMEQKMEEKLFDIEYTKFIEVFNRLAQHPYAIMAEDLIKQYWIATAVEKDSEIPVPESLEDGTQTLTVHLAQRKTSLANVKLSYPGTGRIRINNLGLDYFHEIQSREQVGS